MLRGLESAMLSFDFRHLPNELIYDEHYRLAIFVRPSRCMEEECDAARNFLGPKERYPCRQPIHLSNWFSERTTPKNVLFNMTLIALDDVIFKIEVHILNGMWLPAVDFFRNSATVQVLTPKRARHLDEYTQNVLEEETRFDDVDWLTLMMIYSGTGFLAGHKDKDLNNRPGPDAAELYKTPVKDKLRRKLSPYVSFEERDTDLFHMIGIFYNDDTVPIAASRDFPEALRHRRDSPPSHNEVGGFVFDFEHVSGEIATRYCITRRPGTTACLR